MYQSEIEKIIVENKKKTLFDEENFHEEKAGVSISISGKM